MKLLSLKCIGNQANHNALTDLIDYNKTFLCCFREGEFHAGGKNGKIRILCSKNGLKWNEAALLNKKGIDLRDPMLSQMPDGSLMLNMGGSTYKGDKLITYSPHVAFSNNGLEWSSVVDLKMNREWIWRVTWHNGIGYGVSYHIPAIKNKKKPWLLKLFKTTNGIDYTLVKQLDISCHPSEVTLRFLPDGTMIALVRRHGNAWIGHSQAPYTQWNWFKSQYRLGGPNFIILPNGKMWAAARYFEREGGKRKARTALYKMGSSTLEPVLIFPSDGDTSYPGIVHRGDKLYISYYSSHETKTKVYFATLKL